MAGPKRGPALSVGTRNFHSTEFADWCLCFYERGYSVRFISEVSGATERVVRLAIERACIRHEHSLLLRGPKSK